MIVLKNKKNPKKEKPKIRERVSRSTNYAPDTHSIFCKRCYAYNNGCPNTRSKIKDKECGL